MAARHRRQFSGSITVPHEHYDDFSRRGDKWLADPRSAPQPPPRIAFPSPRSDSSLSAPLKHKRGRSESITKFVSKIGSVVSSSRATSSRSPSPVRSASSCGSYGPSTPSNIPSWVQHNSSSSSFGSMRSTADSGVGFMDDDMSGRAHSRKISFSNLRGMFAKPKSNEHSRESFHSFDAVHPEEELPVNPYYSPSMSCSSQSRTHSPASSISSLPSTGSSIKRRGAIKRLSSDDSPVPLSSLPFEQRSALYETSLMTLYEFSLLKRAVCINPDYFSIVAFTLDQSRDKEHFLRLHFPSIRVWMTAELCQMRWRIGQAKLPLAMRSPMVNHSKYQSDGFDVNWCIDHEDDENALQVYALKRINNPNSWLFHETPAERGSRIAYLQSRRERLARGDELVKFEELEAEAAYVAWLHAVELSLD